jgi:hypothetical protein
MPVGIQAKAGKKVFSPYFPYKVRERCHLHGSKESSVFRSAHHLESPGLDKIFGTYVEELGGYRYLYRFHPEKKGTYNLEVAFQMESDGQKREGKAKTKIYVR